MKSFLLTKAMVDVLTEQRASHLTLKLINEEYDQLECNMPLSRPQIEWLVSILIPTKIISISFAKKINHDANTDFQTILNFLEKLSKYNFIRKINISGYNFGYATLELIQQISQIKNLTKLVLSENTTKMLPIIDILKILKNMSHLIFLSMAYNNFGELGVEIAKELSLFPALRELNYSGNLLGSYAPNFAKNLKARKLTILSLDENQLERYGNAMLTKFNKNLKLEALSLADNKLGYMCQALGQALFNNFHLKKISLLGNNMGSNLLTLAQFLIFCPSLQILSVNNDNQSTKELILKLKMSATLKKLHIEDACLKDFGSISILIKKQTHFDEVYLQGIDKRYYYFNRKNKNEISPVPVKPVLYLAKRVGDVNLKQQLTKKIKY